MVSSMPLPISILIVMGSDMLLTICSPFGITTHHTQCPNAWVGGALRPLAQVVPRKAWVVCALA